MPLAEDQYVVQALGSVVDEELFGLSARGSGRGRSSSSAAVFGDPFAEAGGHSGDGEQVE
jgi:hypothetical protein